jgi:anaerobic ribonucleoside-triphosphate reductase
MIINKPDSMTIEEAMHYVNEEVEMCDKRRVVTSVDILLDGDNIIVKTNTSGKIIRVRRITGYLAPIESFNDAKRRELYDRYAHMTPDQRAIRE